MNVNPADRFLPSPFVRGAVHAGRTILLDLSRERYYGLDEVGTRVWALLVQGVEVREMVACLGEVYEAPRERLEADVADILRYLLGLKVIAPAGPLYPPSSLSSALTLIVSTMALRLLGLRRSLALAQRLGLRPAARESPTPEFLADVVRKVGTAGGFLSRPCALPGAVSGGVSLPPEGRCTGGTENRRAAVPVCGACLGGISR